VKHEELIEVYLQDLERALAGSEAAERDDVVCSVREHIDLFLAGEPITEERVRQVLDNLGPVERIARETFADQGTDAALSPGGQRPGAENRTYPAASPTYPAAGPNTDPPGTERPARSGAQGNPHGPSPSTSPLRFPTEWRVESPPLWVWPIVALLLIACLVGLATHPIAVVVTACLVTFGVSIVHRNTWLGPPMLVAGIALAIWIMVVPAFFLGTEGEPQQLPVSTVEEPQGRPSFETAPSLTGVVPPSASPSPTTSPSPSGSPSATAS
jgi:hypothetical protein